MKQEIEQRKHDTDQLARYRWRPISEIHEDYGPCVVMRIDDLGDMEIHWSNEIDFDPKWTHFAQVPRLTIEEAEALKAAMAPTESVQQLCNPPDAR